MDRAGKGWVCVQLITVQDITAPIITCPANTTVSCQDNNTSTATGTATATDNCATGNVTITQSETSTQGANPAYSNYYNYTITRTWKATDPSGNSSTCIQTITVQDVTAPVYINCPPNITVYTGVGRTTCDQTATWTAPTATDNCSSVSVLPSHNPGATFPKGITTVTYKFTDVTGNSSTCTFTVTVVDNTAPTITCPTNITQNADAGVCNASVAVPSPTTFDNCGVVCQTWSYSGATSGSSPATGINFVGTKTFNVGVTTVTYVIKDAAGNSATCSCTVTVVDNQAPSITCKANQVRNTNPNVCTYITSGYEFDKTSAFDNCGYTLSYSLSGMTTTVGYVNASSLSGIVFNKGLTTVTWKATDPAGNSTTCSFTVTVNDNQAPAISCPGNITGLIYNPAICGAVATYTPPVGTDNCPGAITTLLNSAHASGSVFPIGTTVVTYKVTDVSGNTVTCSFNVTVGSVATTSSLTITGNPLLTPTDPATTAQQYSDTVRFCAKITGGASPCGPQAADSVKFYVGTQLMGKVKMNIVGADLVGVLTEKLLEGIVGQMSPGNKTVSAVFCNVNSAYTVPALANQTLTIKQEDARITYNGDIIKATANATTYSAYFTLSAKVMDITVPQSPADPAFDNYPGDIRNAKVMFVDRDNSDAPISGWLTVNLVDPSDLKIGNAIFTGPGYLIGGLSSSTPSKQVTVGVIVDYGYYIRNSDDDDVVLTVYLPVGDFITGGGYIIPNESVGTKASDDGKKANFGFNVKFGNGGKNLQGSMNIIFRRTESDGLVHNYQIKANSMQSLGVNATNPNRQTAEYVSKVTLKDLTNPLSTDPNLGGNRMLYVKMIDNGEPGVNDSISFVIVAGNANPSILANVIWSSNWVGSMTQMMKLGGGNLQVHSGFSVGSSNLVSSGPGGMKSTAETETKPVIVTPLTAKAFPNPSETNFNLFVEGGSNDEVQIVVYNVKGAIVHQVKGTSNRNYKFGNGWIGGMYFVQVRQGSEVKMLQVMKQ